MLLAGGLTGVLWSVAALPSFWLMTAAGDVATRIIVDDRFKPGALARVLAALESQPAAAGDQPEFLRSRALLKLRMAEEAMTRNSSEEADRSVSLALQDLKSALSTRPGDSFLWLLLYSIETTRGGFDPKYLRYLDQSYATGPHEGWVSLRRNRLALSAFPKLSEAVQSAVISEFEEMVDADFIEDAALNLIGTGWQHREQLLAALGSADIASRQSLHKRLAADGIKLNMPGIAFDERPWR
ncbi:hypothetical protein EAS61_36970 [Bradyrhizobium zhanjiangense]|uniref:Uncharacterized protein n=1 Tax=Bradyrhizobium zhanjiangense TaxID=1325107 RepID=A0A4Q0Q8J8_9BRAD|nr:hypothetical protein EAS61_36970 [Bradyrhizobium zhanjiangense]